MAIHRDCPESIANRKENMAMGESGKPSSYGIGLHLDFPELEASKFPLYLSQVELSVCHLKLLLEHLLPKYYLSIQQAFILCISLFLSCYT